MDKIADCVQEIAKRMADGDFDISEAKIIMKLVNTEWNRQMVESVPHREFCDLSVTYRIFLGMEEESIVSVLVSDQIAEMAGMTEQQLYEKAAIDTKKLFPPTVTDINSELGDIMALAGMDGEAAEAYFDEIPMELPMYIISNSIRINGAVSMLYEEELHGLAESMGTDLYILPSSIHEVIAVPTAGHDPAELVQMVTGINMGEVMPGERLSNQVYRYDRKSRKTSIA